MILLLLACSPISSTEAEERLEASLVKEAEDKDVHNAVLHVASPQLGIEGTWVAGEARSGTPMDAQTPFLSASVGKLFTATAVVALAERGELSLEDPVSDWIPAEELAGLPIQGGDAAFDELRVEQLLCHRSGLPDYFEGETHDGEPNLLELMSEEPDRSWTRAELLDYTRDHFDAVGAPGEQFLYSDTNYDLLGLVLEGVTGLSWHEAIRVEVIDPVGLESTWYHSFEEPPEDVGEIASVWIDDLDLSDRGALSLDQAGGGLATTSADLALFLRSLEQGEPIHHSSLESWTPDAMNKGMDYGRGMWRVRPGGVSVFLSDEMSPMLGASGATGSFAYLAPGYDAVIVGTFDQTGYAAKHLQFLLSKVVPVLDAVDPSI